MTRVIEMNALSDLYPIPPDEPIPLSRDIYYVFLNAKTNPLLAHVCTASGRPRWMWQGTDLHTLMSREPLHLEASIGWQSCCGRHGFIRDGQWEPSNDGGWTP